MKQNVSLSAQEVHLFYGKPSKHQLKVAGNILYNINIYIYEHRSRKTGLNDNLDDVRKLAI